MPLTADGDGTTIYSGAAKEEFPLPSICHVVEVGCCVKADGETLKEDWLFLPTWYL